MAEAAGEFVWKALPSFEEALARGQLTLLEDGPQGTAACPDCPPGGPEPHADLLEPLQWDMEMIRAPEAHATQAGSRAVQVGILDTGIDGLHLDFVLDEDGTNVDCASGRNFVPAGPGVGLADPCIDNNFHGTHVAGTVAARANGHGIVGVAPNVTLIPVKVCDALGYCYSNASAAAITYAGDAKFEVINMSYFVDDDQLLASTEFKCMSDPVQRAFRHANERAIQYARNQGVVPVAALGNSATDLAHPPEPYENECDVVPAETQGVIGTMSLGPSSEKAFYSNFGFGMTDVAAPGGNSRNRRGETPGPCGNQILSTIPGNVWGCFQGTSMASPHAAGVAALIVSQFGRIRTDAGEPDVVMRPQQVESYLEST
ncbi:MAG: S8 family serine peptidase, partial [Actinobacteria bacterium]|nr:S8 family serine peptidase [Actinomycetota bacterium]